MSFLLMGSQIQLRNISIWPNGERMLCVPVFVLVDEVNGLLNS